jgi:hypothetical protein
MEHFDATAGDAIAVITSVAKAKRRENKRHPPINNRECAARDPKLH